MWSSAPYITKQTHQWQHPHLLRYARILQGHGQCILHRSAQPLSFRFSIWFGTEWFQLPSGSWCNIYIFFNSRGHNLSCLWYPHWGCWEVDAICLASSGWMFKDFLLHFLDLLSFFKIVYLSGAYIIWSFILKCAPPLQKNKTACVSSPISSA